MAKLSLTKGRVNQKLKTREALLAKGNEMILQGITINLEQVAKEIGISKATAYRYFGNSEGFKREASLQLKAKTSDCVFSDLSKEDLQGRLDRLIDYHFKLFTENEIEFRLFLSSIINESITNKNSYSRGGRRIALIEEALEPLKTSVKKNEFEKIVYTLSLIFGIESITIYKDICGLNNYQILENWKWTVNRVVFGK